MKAIAALLLIAGSAATHAAPTAAASLAEVFECKVPPNEAAAILRANRIDTSGTDLVLQMPITVYGTTVSKVVADAKPGVLTLFSYIPVASIKPIAKLTGMQEWEDEMGAGYGKQLAPGRDLSMDDTSHEGGIVALQCTMDT
ncbi:TPA: hypothetical protein HH296_17910 [Xanthomonas vasicola pv. zeae]|uniref:hypothetical protein n=1 Tax=Xanthomonas TaxID=338 RepID=UPI0002D4FAAF|nr:MULTISPECIES: hypothetical protein [Xanthomonas]QRD58307.1 hypothetical protein H8Z75_23135 [Xanthomonas citri pv. citri]HHZ24270.1 hypothetical protein [Xanthomonas vasicola pv. zeae]HHZ28508.1 hypothetical protein [Xanthomonas vasicola pv. zeae]HHZ52748.1 hypothetical protein [Xanthomonas vasicola pv. zeae]